METTDKLPEIVERYVAVFNEKHNTKIKLVKKSSSKLMKVIAVLLWLFNRTFMTHFYTTIGQTVYVPDYAYNKDVNVNDVLEVIMHESVHAYDAKRFSVIFPFSYLMPQVFGLFLILAPFNVAALVSLVFLLPLPAFFRMMWEVRAYKVTPLLAKHVYGYDEEGVRLAGENAVTQLSGANYYFTWPFKSDLKKRMSQIEGLETQAPYSTMLEFLAKENKQS